MQLLIALRLVLKREVNIQYSSQKESIPEQKCISLN